MAMTTTPIPAGWPLNTKAAAAKSATTVAGTADATTWVMRDPEGQLQRIKVVDMTDQHLFRWIQLFRRKYREQWFPLVTVPDDVVDARIQRGVVTAPAIYAEAAKRGVVVTALLPLTDPPPKPVVVPTQGQRRIDLNED